MSNYAIESDYKYTEMAIALHDYEFGSVVKFSIPSLFTFLPKNSPISNTHKTDVQNIMNKEKPNTSQYTSCNYIEIYVDWSKSRGREHGYKNDKYAVTFVGGNINTPIIVDPI